MPTELDRRRLLQTLGAAGIAVTGMTYLPSALAHARPAFTPATVVPGWPDPFDDTKVAPMEQMLGRTIQLSPYFDYYADRSLASVADELYVQGYRAVHINTTDETYDYGSLVEALRSRGIRVWMIVSGRGSYDTTGWPEEWPTWRLSILKENPDNPVTSFSLFSKDYLHFKKESVARKLQEVKWDGIGVAECGFPSWSGLATKANYGDVGPLAQAAFQEEYGLEIPEFLDTASPRYYQTDTERYETWVNFRADGVNRFLAELFNGTGGIREADPLVRVATWSLGVNYGVDPVSEQKEREGYDAAGMVAAVQPDLHIIQTNWPDWLPPEQTPDYLLGYQPFIDEIRAVDPDLPIGTQTDSGSRPTTNRSLAWMNDWEGCAATLGFATTTAYQYSSLGSTYETSPELRAWYRARGGAIVLSFTKRLQLKQPAGIISLDDGHVLSPEEYSIDGSWIVISSGVVRGGRRVLTVSGVLDDPATRLRPEEAPANAMVGTVQVELTGSSGETAAPR